MFFPIEEWFPAFLLTLVVEVVVVLLLLRRSGAGPWRLALLTAFANLATHPVAWFAITQLYVVGSTAYLAAAEGWAMAAEAVFWWAVLPAASPRRVIAVAVAANLASFVAGVVLGDARLGIVPSA